MCKYTRIYTHASMHASYNFRVKIKHVCIINGDVYVYICIVLYVNLCVHYTLGLDIFIYLNIIVRQKRVKCLHIRTVNYILQEPNMTIMEIKAISFVNGDTAKYFSHL